MLAHAQGGSSSSSSAGSGKKEPVDWGIVGPVFLFSALGGALFGYDIGATSGALPSLTSPELSGTDWCARTLHTVMFLAGIASSLESATKVQAAAEDAMGVSSSGFTTAWCPVHCWQR